MIGPVPNAANKVPLMFQAQAQGRCQLQYASSDDVQRWAQEWTSKAYADAPLFGAHVSTATYKLAWRFVTNGGQDDNIVRPVIGSKGWPYYPGSSMKGAFRRACTAEQAERYCGRVLSNGDVEPGILRFHGGYPTDLHWKKGLVDIVHPQERRQVKKDLRKGSAYAQISLYNPQFKFGISSKIELEESEWKTIWQLWKRAVSSGLGCRVSAGYGQPEEFTGKVVYRTQLQGWGQAPRLLDGTPEFRPNMFRAGLRSHALRLFGGLTNAATAERLVGDLFGSTRGGSPQVGLLAMKFKVLNDPRKQELEPLLRLGTFDGGYEEPTYDVIGDLQWLLTQSLGDTKLRQLVDMIGNLNRFAMLLGGFGKSWRRAHHKFFYPDYYEGNADKKPLIGCHWERVDPKARCEEPPLNELNQIAPFIDQVRDNLKEWMRLQEASISTEKYANWREAWHPDTVQVWGRIADGAEDSQAIRWLHGPYRTVGSRKTIYQTPVTGSFCKVGRLWHRMFSITEPDRNDQGRPWAKSIDPTQGRGQRQFLELLTLFPDGSKPFNSFLQFLNQKQNDFQKLWPSN